MNTMSRVVLVAMLCTAAVACSKKVKEVPPPVTVTPETPITQPADTAGI